MIRAMQSIEQHFLDSYLSNIDIINDGLPMWFNARRSDAVAALHLSGLPDRHDERYRYSDVRELFSGEPEQYFVPRRRMAAAPLLLDMDAYRIELVNGRCPDGRLLISDEGIAYGSLREAARSPLYASVVEEWLDSVADVAGDGAAALTRIFVQDGAFVYLPEGVELNRPIVLDNRYHTDDESELCFTQTLVVAGRGARADIIVSHRSSGTGRVTVGYTREAVVEEDADIHFSELFDMERPASLVMNSYLRQRGGSRCSTMCCKCGEGYLRAMYNTDLAAPHASNELWGLYLCDGDEHCDIGVTTRHSSSDCSSYSLVKGAAAGDSVGAFSGHVYVAPDAQHTDAQQQSRNLLLSDRARIHTRPQLEIYADDVKCSHGATVGQLDDEAIYYMRQRGLSEAQARLLQIEGFAYDVTSHCRHAELCRYIGERTSDKFKRMW